MNSFNWERQSGITGEVVLSLLTLGVVRFWSRALGVRCQFMACFWPAPGPGSVPPGRWLSVGHDGLPRRVRRGPASGVLGGSWIPHDMEDEKGHGPQYPAHGGAIISGDHPRGLETQGATRDLATCDPVPGVQAQGTLGSGATCANPDTSDDPGNWQSEHSRQLVVMTQPTSHREQ